MALYHKAGACDPVAKSWTIPTIVADYDGYWDGQLNYNPNRGMYIFSFSNFYATPPEYDAFMHKIEASLRKLAQSATNQDLAMNLLFW